MFGSLCKNLRSVVRASTILERYVFRQNPSRFSPLRYISSYETSNQHSFTVSYLINSCGLSPASAQLASKRVHFEMTDKPDKFLLLLKNRGFTQTQISSIVKSYPHLLLSAHEKTILPKLDFFLSQGFSTLDTAKILSHCPSIFTRSLKKCIIPTFDFLKDLLYSNGKTLKDVIMRTAFILCHNAEKEVAPKINFLIDHGLPRSSIVYLLCYHPAILLRNWERLKETMEETKGMGLNPSKSAFVRAAITLAGISQSTWEKKVNVFKRWDWSEDDILLAFRRYPYIMLISEDKIMAVMDLIINNLGWESSCIVSLPSLLGYSLEKRLIPRAAILQFLLSKGLVKKNFRDKRFFILPEAMFFERFVNCYCKSPELLKLYGEKLALSNSKESAKI